MVVKREAAGHGCRVSRRAGAVGWTALGSTAMEEASLIPREGSFLASYPKEFFSPSRSKMI
jgi:hypothetical protein